MWLLSLPLSLSHSRSLLCQLMNELHKPPTWCSRGPWEQSVASRLPGLPVLSWGGSQRRLGSSPPPPSTTCPDYSLCPVSQLGWVDTEWPLNEFSGFSLLSSVMPAVSEAGGGWKKERREGRHSRGQSRPSSMFPLSCHC